MSPRWSAVNLSSLPGNNHRSRVHGPVLLCGCAEGPAEPFEPACAGATGSEKRRGLSCLPVRPLDTWAWQVQWRSCDWFVTTAGDGVCVSRRFPLLMRCGAESSLCVPAYQVLPGDRRLRAAWKACRTAGAVREPDFGGLRKHLPGMQILLDYFPRESI
jgi:hypothetical protein